jgi:hypothetical protein
VPRIRPVSFASPGGKPKVSPMMAACFWSKVIRTRQAAAGGLMRLVTIVI